jgi:hypothetical protein
MLARTLENPIPTNVRRLESFTDENVESFYFALPAGVHCGFQVRTDHRGWRAAYGDSEADVFNLLENLKPEIPEQSTILI